MEETKVSAQREAKWVRKVREGEKGTNILWLLGFLLRAFVRRM